MPVFACSVVITLASWFIICFTMPDVPAALADPGLYPFLWVMKQSMSITRVAVELTIIVALPLFANVCYLTARTVRPVEREDQAMILRVLPKSASNDKPDLRVQRRSRSKLTFLRSMSTSAASCMFILHVDSLQEDTTPTFPPYTTAESNAYVIRHNLREKMSALIKKTDRSA